MPKRTADIVTEIKNGSRTAFKELFYDYYPTLCVFASRYVPDPDVCKDIAQESLLSYWERREKFDDLLKVKGFLYTVVHNLCLNHLKHESFNVADYIYSETEPFEFRETLIEQETYHLIHQAVDSLPAQMKRIILLSMQGKKNQEIAAELGIAEGTVHKLKKIAYRKLREQLSGVSLSLLLLILGGG